MRTERRIRHLVSPILWAAFAALLGCAETQPRAPAASVDAVQDAAATAERVALLSEQVASLERYTAQMEKLYASQEAEILSLRRQLAGSASCPAPPSPAAHLAASAGSSASFKQ
jgi:hypothetical protein